MKLSYRGVSYDYNPPAVTTATSQASGKYRGQDWRFRNLKRSPILQPTKQLVYRGVLYQTGQASNSDATSIQEQSRKLFLAREQDKNNRQQSMLSRAAAQINANPQLA